MLTDEPAADRLPLTASQQGLLLVHGRAGGAPVYNMLVRFDLDPAYGAAAVEEALLALVAVQPAFRQVFEVLPEPHARLTPPPDALPAVRVTVPAADLEQAVATTARDLGRPEFDLAHGPAYRFATVRADDGSASVLLLADHHIILDGLSLAPIVGDLERLLVEREPAGVAATAATREKAYRAEVAAQHRVASSPAVAERVDAWAERLRTVPPLELAPGPGRPAETAYAGARVGWSADDDETAAVDGLCRRLGISPLVLFTGLYGAVLGRHGRTDQVLVTSPFLARRTARSLDLCGFFVNTLPITVDVDWSAPADEWLAGPVKAAVDFTRANADVSFTQLVAAAAPDRSGNRNPLAAAMFSLQNAVAPRPAGAVRRITEIPNDTAMVDLWFGATMVDGRWQLELEYDTGLIAPPVADGLLASLRGAVRQVLADPATRLADLFTDASAAVSRRTDGWRSRLPEESLADCVEAVARRRPEAVAVAEANRSVSYGELVETAARVSGGLAERGIGPGDVVGLAAEGLGDTVIAILAILRCGATFLPLEASLPADRLAHMVDKAGCRLLVGRGLVPGVPAVGVLELAVAEPAASKADPDAPVYVMFTSGSTGRPKGVLMGQRWLSQFAAWQVDAMAMDEDTRFLQYAPLGFDVCFQEIVPALVSGGTVVSREPADRRDFAAVLRRIAESGATHVYLPVAALRPVVRLAVEAGLRLPALRYLCVSGEQLLVDDQVREFFTRHPHCALVNHYGPTETNAVTTYWLSAADERWPAHVPIGRPLPGVAAYVVDVTGRLAPTGVAGELYLGDRCPADGYVNDPELTEARFRPDPYGSGRVYRTGDLVVRDERGELVFLGRLDTQVKIRGHRVELGEIEVVAAEVAGVRRAVAVAVGDGADREIALFLVPEPGTVDFEPVRARLAERLPTYMWPRRLVPVEAIPTSGTGKTDRSALLRMVPEEPEPAAPPAYADELEAALAGRWAQILGTDQVAADRPLLEYGAHSISLFTGLTQVQQEYGVQLPIGAFFAAPTVATLAALVRAARPAS